MNLSTVELSRNRKSSRLDAAPGAPSLLNAQEQPGFELGWDYAHHGATPPGACALEDTSLRTGLLAGRAAFGARTLPATHSVQLWLQLRLSAWLRGRCVEAIQITPRYLEQLETGHCPITRVALQPTSVFTNDAAFTRVRNDAGYAAGNLALLSTKANHAKGNLGHAETLRIARQLEGQLQSGIQGLNAAQWSRLAVLCSFVEPLPHAQARELPLLVMPPNRLRLFNPAQLLQVFISRQLLTPGWSLRVSRIEALVPGKAARHAFQTFFHALLPRVLEAGRNVARHELRWAIEDAWRHPLVLQRWSALAGQLSAQQCEALVVRGHAKRLGHGVVQLLDDNAATEGWGLESQGFIENDVSKRQIPGRCIPRSNDHSRALRRTPRPGQQGVLPLH